MAADSFWDELPSHLARLMEPLSRGLSNAEIAGELSLSLHTVENYMSEILEASGEPDRSRLVLCALREVGRRGETEEPAP